MISHHQSQPATVTGYFQYLSQNQARVNVGPHEGADNDEVMTETTTETITPSSDETVMNNDNNNSASGINVSSSENAQAQETSSVKDKDVTVWSSSDVKQWVDEQCQKFELKTTTTDKFQMNGQALILLTKHDFLRRSPDGGEILYYALQRLINPHKSNSIRTNRNSMRNGSWRHSTRIVEIGSDTDEHNSSVGSPSSSKPIVEEPDDPPLYRRSDSDIFHENHPYQHYPHSFLHSHSHMRPPIFTMPNAAYYHQQQVYPNAYMYAHHMHPQMSQQQYFHPHQHAHFAHQYHPMMGAQGVVIEVIDNDEAKNYANNGVHSSSNDNSTNGAANTDTQEQLFMVTINGQRYVMNEEQVNSYVTEVQRQQQQQQQQQFQQQQQQHFHHHQQQPQQPQQQPQQPQQQQQFHQHPQPAPTQFHQQQQQQRQPPPSQFHQHQQQQQPFAYQQRQTSQDPLFHPT